MPPKTSGKAAVKSGKAAKPAPQQAKTEQTAGAPPAKSVTGGANKKGAQRKARLAFEKAEAEKKRVEAEKAAKAVAAAAEAAAKAEAARVA